MNAIINKTGNVIQKIIWVILVAMFGILSIFNILGTTKIDIKVNDYKEYAEYSLNNILMIILYVVTIFAILYIIDRYTKLLKMDTKKFANIATIYVIVIGIAYIVMARAYPISDQSVVQRIASSFLDGDYSVACLQHARSRWPHVLHSARFAPGYGGSRTAPGSHKTGRLPPRDIQTRRLRPVPQDSLPLPAHR